jgi:spore coat polysaccharide biosynthesis protein SpsF
MKIVTAIQARTSSARLPQKVLMPLCGEPLLIRIVERVGHSSLKGKVVVATSTLPEDNIIEELCLAHGIQVFRGHPTDLLDRHYQLAKTFNAEAVVKIPSDCPLIDPRIIDQVIAYYLAYYPEFDYVSNLHPATFPDGNDVEIMSVEALENAWNLASRDFEREHTTPYIWENPLNFRIGNVRWSTGIDLSTSHRFTIDYPEDYEFIKEVYDNLYLFNPSFNLDDILQFLHEKPSVQRINQKYAGRYWYEKHLEELNNIKEYKEKILQSEINSIDK